MLLSVVHSTTYHYADAVHRSTQYIRLTPYASPRQRTVRWDLKLPGAAVTMRDAFDNITHVLTLDVPHDTIHIEARGQVDVDETDDGEAAGRINPMVFLRSTPLTAVDDALREFVEPIRPLVKGRPLMAVSDLMNAVLERMPYAVGATSADSTAAQAFAAGKGLGQDHAHVFVACARLLGIPARYVSGYAHSPGSDKVASHAWAEAWLANRWHSFDVSNARGSGGALIKLAIGLDYLDACPVRGVRLGGGEENLKTTAEVRPAH